MEIRELFADLGAIGVSGGAARDQRLPGLEYECLHLPRRNAEDEGDLLVAQPVELSEHECGSLVIGKAADIVHEVAEVLAQQDLGGETFHGRLGDSRERLVSAAAQDRVAAVARDREKPGPQVDRLIGVDERVVSGQECVLDRILSLLGVAEHVMAEGQHRPVVAIVERLECRSAPLPNQGNQM